MELVCLRPHEAGRAGTGLGSLELAEGVVPRGRLANLILGTVLFDPITP
jgi:hypothetical protein